MKIIIGYDGSESGDQIFADLTRAGLPREAAARVVAVADLYAADRPPVDESDPHSLASRRVEMVLKQAADHRQKVLKETEDSAARAVERLRAQFPEWTIEKSVKTGTPAWELIEAANEFNADLIVVGSQGRSAIGRFFLGSVSKKLATDARCSVRVARSGNRKDADAAPRIIVGADGSPAAEEAIYAVGQRVWQSGTEVKLIAARDAPPNSMATRLPQAGAMINDYIVNQKTRVSAMLDWAAEEFKNINLKTSVLTKSGDAKTILLEEAESWNADCIFVGTRDFKSAFERFRLGSVSTAIVTNAACSVEIVRPPESAQA